MDTLQFYPTPIKIATRAVDMLTVRKGRLLEPSAGRGHLLRGLKETQCYYARQPNFDIFCVEIDPTNCAVLEKEGYKVLQADFLTADIAPIYDVVLMNPPFNAGVKHILKAWDCLRAGGELIAIINAETINNDFSTERKMLADKIAKYGQTIELGEAFADSERPTNVNCSYIQLKKPNAEGEFDFSAGLDSEDVGPVSGASDAVMENGLIRADFVSAAEDDYRRGLEKMFAGMKEIALGWAILNARFGHSGLGYILDNDEDARSLSDTVEEALKAISWGSDKTPLKEQLRSSMDYLVKGVRAQAWLSVLDKTHAQELLYSQDRAKFVADVLDGSRGVAFSKENIKSFLLNIFQQREKLFTSAVVKLFNELRRYHHGTREYTEGWKTNKSWKVPMKIILPRGVSYEWGSFNVEYRQDYVDDLDRVVRILSMKDKEYGTTIKQALKNKFAENRKKGISAGDTTETEFFRLRYFKKGTLHIEFKEAEICTRINVIGAGDNHNLPDMEA